MSRHFTLLSFMKFPLPNVSRIVSCLQQWTRVTLVTCTLREPGPQDYRSESEQREGPISPRRVSIHQQSSVVTVSRLCNRRGFSQPTIFFLFDGPIYGVGRHPEVETTMVWTGLGQQTEYPRPQSTDEPHIEGQGGEILDGRYGIDFSRNFFFFREVHVITG